MDFDQFSVGPLTTQADAPLRSDEENDAIQDAHRSHLSDLHHAGSLLCAGPLADRHLRGMILFRTDVATASELMADAPAVRARWFDVAVVRWMVPCGAMEFAMTTFPRSVTDLR